jgi:hypothetical protein
MNTSSIRVAYGALLGAVLAVAVGFGVNVFAAGPRPPQPAGITFTGLSGTPTPQESDRQTKQIDSFYSAAQTYREQYPTFQRNVFIWYAALGLAVAVMGVALPAVVNYLRFGLLLGGTLLLVAGIWVALQPVPPGAPAASSLLGLLSAGTPRVLDTGGRFMRFALALVGLLALLFVGLWRLTDWATPATSEPRPPAGYIGAPYAVAPDAPPDYAPTPVPADAKRSGPENPGVSPETAQEGLASPGG